MNWELETMNELLSQAMDDEFDELTDEDKLEIAEIEDEAEAFYNEMEF